MRPQMTHPHEMARLPVAPPARAEISGIAGKYLSITSYRRDGTGVATLCGS